MIFRALVATAVLFAGFASAQTPAATPATPAAVSAAPSAAVAPPPCLIVKHHGRAAMVALISKGSTYDRIDSFGIDGTRMQYRGSDLELLQSSHIKVIVVQEKYSLDELNAARDSCMRP